MFLASHRYSFGCLPVILALFHPAFAQAESLTTYVRDLPPELVRVFGHLSPRVPGETVADLFLCDPYCEPVGKISGSRERSDSGALTIDFIDETAKSRSLAPTSSDKLRVVSKKPIENRSARQAVAGRSDPRVNNAARSSNPRPNATSPSRATTPKSGASRPSSRNARRSPPPPPPGSWDLSALLGASFGARNLSTNANTNLESGAKLHLAYEARIGLRGVDLLPLWGGAVSAGAEIQFQSTLSETPPSSASPRESQMIQGGVLFMAEWRKRNSPWGYSFLLEPRYASFTTKPETADGFSSTYVLASPGLGISYRNTSLRILKSVYGIAQDSVSYRGEEASAGSLRIELRSCAALGKAIGASLSLCGNVRRETFTVQASGTPLRPVFTPNGKYDYPSTRFGIEVGLTGFSL